MINQTKLIFYFYFLVTRSMVEAFVQQKRNNNSLQIIPQLANLGSGAHVKELTLTKKRSRILIKRCFSFVLAIYTFRSNMKIVRTLSNMDDEKLSVLSKRLYQNIIENAWEELQHRLHEKPKISTSSFRIK